MDHLLLPSFQNHRNEHRFHNEGRNNELTHPPVHGRGTYLHANLYSVHDSSIAGFNSSGSSDFRSSNSSSSSSSGSSITRSSCCRVVLTCSPEYFYINRSSVEISHIFEIERNNFRPHLFRFNVK